MSWSRNSPQVWLCYHHFKDEGWRSNGISNWTKPHMSSLRLLKVLMPIPAPLILGGFMAILANIMRPKLCYLTPQAGSQKDHAVYPLWFSAYWELVPMWKAQLLRAHTHVLYPATLTELPADSQYERSCTWGVMSWTYKPGGPLDGSHSGWHLTAATCSYLPRKDFLS